MKKNIWIAGFLACIWLFPGRGSAQNIFFVESDDVQQAMESYRRDFQKEESLSGYRIQYLFTNDRREMERMVREFKKIYDYVPDEWVHDPPYYRLYAGSFLSRIDAIRFLSEVRKDFPGAILVNASVKVKDVYSCRQKMDGW